MIVVGNLDIDYNPNYNYQPKLYSYIYNLKYVPLSDAPEKSTAKLINEVINPMQGEPEYEDIEVDLLKRPAKGLGLSVVGRRDGCGVFISDMVSKITCNLTLVKA